MSQQFTEKLAEGIQQYVQPKPEGDPDLIAMVREKLISCGLQQKVTASYDTNRFIIDAANKPSSVQRHLLNRYWSLQLMVSSKHTTDERYCLIPNGTVNDWFNLFVAKVLPFIIENDLTNFYQCSSSNQPPA